jgi:hypothetical protein
LNSSEDYDTFGRVELSIVTSFIFIRSVVFLVVCANVYHQAYEPLSILRNVPDGNVCEEVRSFNFINLFSSLKFEFLSISDL